MLRRDVGMIFTKKKFYIKVFSFFSVIPALLVFYYYIMPSEVKLSTIDLKGNWKDQEGHNDDWIESGYDDKDWGNFKIPGRYYKQGFRNNKCVLRKTFELNERMKGEDLFFMFGLTRSGCAKIYVNGIKVGEAGIYERKKRIEGILPIEGLLSKKDISLKGRTLLQWCLIGLL